MLTTKSAKARFAFAVIAATVLAFGVIAAIWIRNRDMPRLTILRGDDAKAVVQFNHSEPEEVYDPDKAGK